MLFDISPSKIVHESTNTSKYPTTHISIVKGELVSGDTREFCQSPLKESQITPGMIISHRDGFLESDGVSKGSDVSQPMATRACDIHFIVLRVPDQMFQAVPQRNYSHFLELLVLVAQL